jgi:hypothetical protein
VTARVNRTESHSEHGRISSKTEIRIPNWGPNPRSQSIMY